jgi:predicted nucleotidyltransferase
MSVRELIKCQKIFYQQGGYMRTLAEISNILRQHITEFQERYKVKEIGIFGSYVKGQQNESSDVDILVEFDDTPDLGEKTDMVRKKAIRLELRDEILRDVVYL